MKRVELYPHQAEAIEKLHSGSILCGGVGSGKSRASLAYFWTRECRGSLSPLRRKKETKLFIITTARKRDTGEWQDEADHFKLKPVIDSWNNISKYIKEKNAFFIFDEQRVVGSGAWVKSFLKITKQNRWILLTATPGDTWIEYVPVFIANGFYRCRSDFTQQHVIWARWSKYPKVNGYFNEGLLLKHRNEILVNMPFVKHTEPQHINLYLPYDEELSNAVIRRRWNPYSDEPLKDAGDLCRCLRRIANEDPSRIEAVKTILAEKKRAIIFTTSTTNSTSCANCLQLLRNGMVIIMTHYRSLNSGHILYSIMPEPKDGTVQHQTLSSSTANHIPTNR